MLVISGETAHCQPSPPGLGATLDAVLAEHPGVRRVVICGGRPAGTMADYRRWVEACGRWVHLSEPYIGAHALRASLGLDGHRVSVQSAAQWFGDASPAAVVEASKHVRHVVQLTGAQMVGSPSRTGLAMLHALWRERGHAYPACPSEVQELLRSTSGQGRFELFDRGRSGRGGRRLAVVDARFQYAALAQTELPVGEPVELRGGEPDEYASAWVHVEFTPPADGPPFGLLPVHDGDGWSWPASGTHRSWCTWAEVHLARRHGYRVRVLAGVVWPRRTRPLARWSAHLVRHRERVLSLPIAPEVAEAVRVALRNVTIQTVGMLQGRPTRVQRTVLDAGEIPDDAVSWRPAGGGRWVYEVERDAEHRNDDAHPEWTVTIWGLARARLAQQMLAQDHRQLVACALDAFYTAGAPVLAPDDGRAGRWRLASEHGAWRPFDTLGGVYRHTKHAEPERLAV